MQLSASEQKTRKVFWPLILGLSLIGLVFIQSLSFDFVNHDDELHLLENPLIVNGVGKPTENPVFDFIFSPQFGYPITTALIAYKSIYSIFGLQAFAFHLFSLLIHLLNSLLVYAIARRMKLSLGFSFFALIFFGVHPLTHQVNWVSDLKTLLATLFSLILVFESLRPGFRIWAKESWRFHLSFLLGLFSKPIIIFVGPVLFLRDLWLEKKDLRRCLLEYLPLAIAAFALLLFSAHSQKDVGARESISSMSIWLREIWYAAGFHLALLLLLIPVSPMHYLASRPPNFSPLIDLLPLAVILVVMAVDRILTGDRRKFFRLALLWFGFCLMGALNILPIKRYLADSFCYQALAGFAWMMSLALEEIWLRLEQRSARLVLGGLMSGLILFFIPLNLSASLAWKNPLNLWKTVEEKYPQEVKACELVGHAYFYYQQAEAAIDKYRDCEKKFPGTNFAKFRAVSLTMLKRYSEARAAFKEALEFSPNDAEARRQLDELDILESKP